MSLRNSVLAALSAAVLLALLGAGVATYSSLRAFLYQRVDESLTSIRPVPERGPGRGPGGPGRPPTPGGSDGLPSAGRGRSRSGGAPTGRWSRVSLLATCRAGR